MRAKQASSYSADGSESPSTKLILEKFALYKTESRFYVIGSNQSDSRHRVLKIDRHYSSNDLVHELHITEDATIYSQAERDDLLKMIEVGNKHSGGMTKVLASFYGIAGFIRFTGGWYMVLIKQRAAVALIGGHYIYHCEEADTLPISQNIKLDRPSEEARLLAAFKQVDLSKNFYFSYTYDLTNTLQANLTRLPDKGQPATASTNVAGEPVHWVAEHAFHEAKTVDTQCDPERILPYQGNKTTGSAWGFNDRFIWNHHLLRTAFMETMGETDKRSCWVLPMVYGFVDQAKLSIFGRTVFVTVIARRSRHFAGARFLKRGVNDEGNVANDVESEQIVSEASTTSFYAPNGGIRSATPRYTSYVQQRGSIPLSWQQDTSTSSLKPPIHLHLVDPYHAAAALHFDDLFARYGTPIVVLNLIKRKEHEPRESRLIKPYKECIDYLNQFLPSENRIQYIPFDMSAAYKSRSMDVISFLEDIAEEVLESTGFFHSGAEPLPVPDIDSAGDGTPPDYRRTPSLQQGVCRMNCIDCLDRTNAAQFVIAKAAFGHQLHALGILADPHLPYDTDAVNMLTEMYHDHGDTIALQYGGSHLVNTMNTYRKINQWKSHSRDMIEGLKRFYSNVALDSDKQNSINLFLGIGVPSDSTNASSIVAATPATLSSATTSPAATLTPQTVTQRLSPVPTTGSHAGSYIASGLHQHQEPDFFSEISEKVKAVGYAADCEPDNIPEKSRRRDYRYWYTAEHLARCPDPFDIVDRMRINAERDGDIWTEYYRPRLFTQLDRHFAYTVNSTVRYNKDANGPERKVSYSSDLSPFKERVPLAHTIPKLHVGVRRWMSSSTTKARAPSTARKTPAAAQHDHDSDSIDSEDETHMAPAGTTEGLAQRLLKPKVQATEAAEYQSYVDQYRNLNLSNELVYESSAGDLQMYERAVALCSGEQGSAILVDQASIEAYEKHCRLHRFQAESSLRDSTPSHAPAWDRSSDSEET